MAGRNEIRSSSAVHTIKGPQIKSYAIEPIAPEEPKEPSVGPEARKIKKLTLEAQAIRRAPRQDQGTGRVCDRGRQPVPGRDAALHHAVRPQKEEANAVRFEASRYIPFKLAESVLDYSLLPTHKNGCFRDRHQRSGAGGPDTSASTTCVYRGQGLMVEPVYCAASQRCPQHDRKGQNARARGPAGGRQRQRDVRVERHRLSVPGLPPERERGRGQGPVLRRTESVD